MSTHSSVKIAVHPWNLFLDDQIFEINLATGRAIRDPKVIDPSRLYILAYDCEKAKNIIASNGCPIFISFDHDLGEGKETGNDLVKWMIEKDLDEEGKFIPEDFAFQVHSANPIGRKNIESLLSNYLKSRKDE